MTRILIGNDFSEDVRSDRGWTGWWVQRLLWFARDGDILLLPYQPELAVIDYVTSLTGVDAASLQILTPRPPGRYDSLTGRCLADEEVRRDVRAAAAGRTVTDVIPLWPDAAVAPFAQSVSIATSVSGLDFLSQGGGLLVNSKSAFRMLAAGAGVALPEGGVCSSRDVAEEIVLDLLDDEVPVMLKHDFLSGGRGNEVLSTGGLKRAIGARRVVNIRGRADVAAYLDENWDWLSASGRGRPIAEQYHRDSSAFFAEFQLTDADVTLGGTGELLSAPYAVGEIMPAQGLAEATLDELVAGARRLASSVHAIGYRGTLSPDAIVTPEQKVLFTEYNGRITGSTHIYSVIGRHVIGEGFGRDRLILDRVWPNGWAVSSFVDARDRLIASGHAYDPATRTGVLLTTAFDGRNGVMYCIAATDLDSAWELDRSLHDLFAVSQSARSF